MSNLPPGNQISDKNAEYSTILLFCQIRNSVQLKQPYAMLQVPTRFAAKVSRNCIGLNFSSSL